MPKILVTGASGLLGGRLASYLKSSGADVILGTRDSRATSQFLKGFTVRQICWSKKHSVREVCEGIDTIIHTAGINASDCAENPTNAFFFNGQITRELIENAVLAGVGQFRFLSTAHVYGAPLLGKLDERSPTLNKHPYAMSNLEGEKQVSFVNNTTEINGISIRISNGFGSPLSPLTNCWH